MILKEEHFFQFLRFCVVGLFATALHYSVYWVLIYHMNAAIAYTIGYVVSFIVNFFLTTYFTFKKRATINKGLGFAISHGVNYILHIVLLSMFLWMGVDRVLAPIPVFCIAVPVNFLFVRYVFKK